MPTLAVRLTQAQPMLFRIAAVALNMADVASAYPVCLVTVLGVHSAPNNAASTASSRVSRAQSAAG